MEKKKSVLSALLPYAENYKVFTILSLVLSALSQVIAFIPFYYIWKIGKAVIEVYPHFAEATDIVHDGWMAVLFSVISMLVYYVGLICSHIAAFHIAANMKKRAMKHISEIPIGKIEEIGSGKLRKIVNESSVGTETYLAHQLPDYVGAMVTPVCMIVLLFIFDWRLGIVSLIPAILGYKAMSQMMGSQMAEDIGKYQDSLEVMNNEAVEYVRGMQVVKTFGQSIFTFKKFKKSIDDYNTFCMAYTKKARLPMLEFEVLINSTFAFLIASALIVNSYSHITTSFVFNMLFYVIYTPLIATTLSKIMFMSEDSMLVEDCIKRIDSILSIQPLPYTNKVLDLAHHDISLKNVQFKYDNANNNAVDHVNMDIKEGSTIALVGPSGSGKSTLAYLMSRFYDPSHGEISIGGVNIRDIEKETLTNTVSFVFQNSKLLKMSIYDNVRLGKPHASREEVLQALHLARCDDIIEKLPEGIDTIIGSEGTYLSGGEQQRIHIARTLLNNTPILILDEATAYADPENEQKVELALKELRKNKTVIMIAHRLSSVKNVDQIYVLDKGQIKESGTHDELVAQGGMYSKMWDDYNTSIRWKVGEKSC